MPKVGKKPHTHIDTVKRRLRKYIPLAVIALIAVMQSCSARKNTAGSRFWQAFTTRYNVYYNGITHYKEQIHDLENNYEDDYSQQLFIHPAEAYSNPKSPQPSASFDRTIEKMQKAISLHSIKKKPKRKSGKGNDPKYKEWLKRDEYNPFIHNAWFTMGKAQYMKGDFTSAAATFHYIVRHFTWKPELVAESELWEALSYCAMGWTSEADNVLAHVHIDKITDKRLRALANLAFADYYIKCKRNAEAIPYLAEAVKGQKGAQSVRLNFLLGQLYQDAGNNDLAYQAYKRAGGHSGSTYRTKFNARIRQSAVYQGNNINGEIRSLKSMARYDRNKEYLDQIYYAIGNIYLSRRDTANAVTNYVEAANKSTRNGIDKAISQITLGGIYFAQHKYDLAQPCYAEAIPQLSEDYPNYKVLKRRSDVLDELSVYAQNVTLQDSLLRLAKLSPDEQKAVIKKIIDALKKKEKEDAENAKREEYLAQQAAKGSSIKSNNQPATYTINSDNSWYFYNTATKNAGKTAFQQLWGNRKLEDDWRRRNKNTFSLGDDSQDLDQASDTTASDTTKIDKVALKHAEDPHYEEYYLKQIPKTDEEILTANNVIQEGLYNMGIILKDKLEDYNSAAYQFNELLDRYPDNVYRLDTYYNMYLMYMRIGEPATAERYRQLILSNFADSKYGMAMKDPNYIDNLKNMEKAQEQMYEQAYADYLSNNNEGVHEAYAEMMRKYPLSKIMPKFMFIDALSYVTQKNYDKFKSTLKEMLERYPETDITPTASGIIKQLNKGRQLNGGSTNARGMLWATRLTNDSTAANTEKKFTPFKEGKDKPQLFVYAFSTDSVSANQLLYEVAKHNFTSFVVKDFELEQMTFGEIGLLVVKGFANYAEVAHYRQVMDADTAKVIPAQAHPIIISQENFDLLVNEGRSFADYFQYLEEQNTAKVEKQIPANATDDATRDAADKPAKRKSVRQAPALPAKPSAKATKATAAPKAITQPDTAKAVAAPSQPQGIKAAPTATGTTVAQPADTAKKATATATGSAPLQPTTTATDSTIADKPVPVAMHDSVPAAKPAEAAKPQSTTNAPAEAQKNADAANSDKNADNVKRLKKQKDEAQLEREREQKQREKEEKERIKREQEAEKARIKQQKDAEKEAKRQLELQQKAHDDSVKLAKKQEIEAQKLAQKQKAEALKQEQQAKKEEQKRQENERKLKQKQLEEDRKQRIEARKQRQKEREQKKKEEQKRKQQEAKARKEAYKQRQKERAEQAKQRAEELKQQKEQKSKNK